jgi:UDP-glucose 6-dehydrogenase
MVAGFGMVGTAVANVFDPQEKIIIDPKYFPDRKISDYAGQRFDAVFVCVDTPRNDNFRLLASVLDDLQRHLPEGTPVCIKSTASPQFLDNARQQYNHLRLTHCPEYLNKNNPNKMFLEQRFLILGGDPADTRHIEHVLAPRLPCLQHIRHTDIKTAALAKYAQNAFLTLRVTFFNEMFFAHRKLGCNSSYEDFAEMLGLDERVGHFHNRVPGDDGMHGWQSHCLDKDVDELIRFTDSPLFRHVVTLNQVHRRIPAPQAREDATDHA